MAITVTIIDFDSGERVDLQYQPTGVSTELSARIGLVHARGQFPVTDFAGMNVRRLSVPVEFTQIDDDDNPEDRLRELQTLVLPRQGFNAQRNLTLVGIGDDFVTGSIEALRGITYGRLDDIGRPRTISLTIVFLASSNFPSGDRQLRPVGLAG